MSNGELLSSVDGYFLFYGVGRIKNVIGADKLFMFLHKKSFLTMF